MRRVGGWTYWGLTVSVALLGMLAAHCAGYQMAALTGHVDQATAVAPAHAHADHAHHLGSHDAASHDAVSAASQHDAASHDAASLDAASHDAVSAAPQHDHGHVVPLASGAFLITVLAGLGLVMAARRRAALPELRLPVLVGVQLAAFVTMELVEHAAHGAPLSGLANSSVLVALALQLPVAWLLARASRTALALIRRLAAVAAAWSGSPDAPSVPLAAGWRPSLGWMLDSARRGPPGGRFVFV